MTKSKAPVKYRYGGDESPSEAVIAALSAVTGHDPLEMDPLYEYVDPDALDAAFRSSPTAGSLTGGLRIEFETEAGHVTVTANDVRVTGTGGAVAD